MLHMSLKKNATVPSDLAEALAGNAKAKIFFESLTRAEQYAVLWQLMTAKTPKTRAVRLARMMTLLESERKI